MQKAGTRMILVPALCGAPEGIRTPNLLIRSQVLYPLSYGRMLWCCSVVLRPKSKVAEARGFEPPDPVKGQVISSDSHSAALARLLDLFRGHRSLRTAEKEDYTRAGVDAKRLVGRSYRR